MIYKQTAFIGASLDRRIFDALTILKTQYKWIPEKVNRKKVATIFLLCGMFFNPFGYDALFKMVLDSTGSYWTTVSIFYCLAGLFFGLYFVFSGTNPIKYIVKVSRDYYNALKKLIRWIRRTAH